MGYWGAWRDHSNWQVCLMMAPLQIIKFVLPLAFLHFNSSARAQCFIQSYSGLSPLNMIEPLSQRISVLFAFKIQLIAQRKG